MKKHEQMMKKHDKMKKNACQLFGCPLEAKTLILLMFFTTTWARALKTTPKNTPKNIKKHEKMMNTNEHTRECSFSENTRFLRSMTTFVKTNMNNQRKNKRKGSKNKADFR